jgi:hypothetical protein
MRELTESELKRVIAKAWRLVEEAVGEPIAEVNKSDAREMWIASKFVEAFTGGAQSAKTFMEQYTTTLILIGKPTIYRPFTLGVPQGGYTLLSQLLVLWHELIHVYQALKRFNRWEFNYRYASFVEFRIADIEVEAVAHSLLAFAHRRGYVWEFGGPDTIAAHFVAYGATSEECATMAEVLRVKGESLVEGVLSLGHPVEEIFLRVIEEEVPWLLEKQR